MDALEPRVPLRVPLQARVPPPQPHPGVHQEEASRLVHVDVVHRQAHRHVRGGVAALADGLHLGQGEGVVAVGGGGGNFLIVGENYSNQLLFDV